MPCLTSNCILVLLFLCHMFFFSGERCHKEMYMDKLVDSVHISGEDGSETVEAKAESFQVGCHGIISRLTNSFLLFVICIQ